MVERHCSSLTSSRVVVVAVCADSFVLPLSLSLPSQNDFCTPNGVLYEAVKGVLESSNALANTASLVSSLRARGVSIPHAPISFTPNYRELTKTPYGILKGWSAKQCERVGGNWAD